MNDRTPVHKRAGTHLLVVMALLALLGGCATLNPDERFAPVERAARERLGKELPRPVNAGDLDAHLDRVDQRVTELLRAPLDAENAVQIALLNNRGLQAELCGARHRRGRSGAGGPAAESGVQRSRNCKRGDEREIERSLHARPGTPDRAAVRGAERSSGALRRSSAASRCDMLALAAETRKA